MIGLPYPKLMNSNNDVDMGAALIMCSVEAARAPRRPRRTGGCSRTRAPTATNTTTCRTATRSIAHRRSSSAGVGYSNSPASTSTTSSVIDLYSCFPAAVQLGAASLGIDHGHRQWSRTGASPFAGGPWNNYVMHAIATVVTDLRERPGEYGLVWANGGYATKHSFGVYSTTPPGDGFRHEKPQAGDRRAAPPRPRDAGDAAARRRSRRTR